MRDSDGAELFGASFVFWLKGHTAVSSEQKQIERHGDKYTGGWRIRVTMIVNHVVAGSFPSIGVGLRLRVFKVFIRWKAGGKAGTS